MQQLYDKYGRKFEYLRLSITDECNFKCNYCLPNGYKKVRNCKLLTQPEIENLVAAFVELGTKKVRITGGEPSLRKDFLPIVSSISQFTEIQKVAVTSNGYKLAKQACYWLTAGIDSINISVDSFNPKTFNLITGKNRLHNVMQGVLAAQKVGIKELKINRVLMKDFNAQELDLSLNWIKKHPVQLRFIELMQTEDNIDFFNQQHISGEFIKQKLLQNGWFEKKRADHDGPAQIFSHTDYQGEIGLIMPYSRDFCKSCNRLRVSSTGRLELCLFSQDGVELRDLLTKKSDKEALKSRIILALSDKKYSHNLYNGVTNGIPNLASIGG